MPKILAYLFLVILFSLKSYGNIDTVRVYFAINVAQLDKEATKVIDSLAYYDILSPGKKIGIIGYADYLGTEDANVILSEARAQNVRSYCEMMGVKPDDIEIVLGKGEIKRTTENGSEGYREDRRVDIIPGGFSAKKENSVTTGRGQLIDVSQLKENQTIRMDNLFFLPGRHFLREESMIELLKLHKVMADNPRLRISIEGHVCCLSNNMIDGHDIDTEEWSLSVNRAKYIYEYLLNKGIAKERMEYKGFGRSRPLVEKEITEEDGNKNRRVEIRILSE